MSWSRLTARMLIAVVSCVIVTGGLLLAFGAAALAIDWDIPEGTQLLGPSSVFDRNGVPLARFSAEVERTEVPLAQISTNLQNAVLATEDRRFYEHKGVDPLSVLRAVVRNVQTGGISEGGSTLTQQYVKTVYVGAERTFTRKIQEAVVSLQFEKERSKDEILALYLNRVYFGEGAYGAEAAARTYFGKPAAELTIGESAILASTIEAPTRNSARNDPVGAVVRRNRVLDQMRDFGLASGAQVASGAAEPLNLIVPERTTPFAPYFVEEVRRQVLEAFGPDLVYNGGLVINTTLDVNQQTTLENAVRPNLTPDPAYEPGVVALDPFTGDVLATWSGRDFIASQVDLGLRQEFGRPSGSTFKVFGLTTALEEGIPLERTYAAPGSITINGYTVKGGGCGGRCSLLEGTVRSINTVFVQVGNEVGVADFTTMARRLGVHSPLSDQNLSQILGTSSVTPLDMASAFGALSNDGIACPARVVLSVNRPDGTPLPPPDFRQPTQEEKDAWLERMRTQGFQFGEEDLGRCYRAVAPTVARTVTSVLQQAVARGTGTRAQIDRPQAGKTGTTDDSRQVWFVGYTPDLAMAVSFAAVKAQVPLRNIPGCEGQCFGGKLPAKIWKDAATSLLADIPPREFPLPGDDARLFPVRRQLGPGFVRPPSPTPEPFPTFTAPNTIPTIEPRPLPTLGPSFDTPTTEPPNDGGEGILEPLLPFFGGPTPTPTPTPSPSR